MLQIALERKKKELTQKQVAEYIGITERAYRRIEIGESEPSYAVLLKIEDLFELQSPHRKLFIDVKRNNSSST